MDQQKIFHEPVLVSEVLESLHVKKGLENQKYIDATLGAGGHSREILKLGGNILGFDADPEMLEIAKKNLEEACPATNDICGSFILTNNNFYNIKRVSQENNFDQVDGILFDLGISTIHYTHSGRGFSFSQLEEPLDMREDPTKQQVSAADLLNGLRQDQLMELFLKAMPFSEARNLSKAVIDARTNKKFSKVGDLVSLTERMFRKKPRTNPATQIFMALRMGVNSELENIETALPDAFDLLKNHGRLAVITFHSTEDKIVKEIFKDLENGKRGKIITDKPIVPTNEEVLRNPKSRSSKLRVIEKYE